MLKRNNIFESNIPSVFNKVGGCVPVDFIKLDSVVDISTKRVIMRNSVHKILLTFG